MPTLCLLPWVSRCEGRSQDPTASPKNRARQTLPKNRWWWWGKTPKFFSGGNWLEKLETKCSSGESAWSSTRVFWNCARVSSLANIFHHSKTCFCFWQNCKAVCDCSAEARKPPTGDWLRHTLWPFDTSSSSWQTERTVGQFLYPEKIIPQVLGSLSKNFLLLKPHF